MKQRFLYVIGLIILLNINLFGARDYSPETGRWTAEDPIGFWSGDINFYAYCANDPVNYIDPSGLSKEGKDGLREKPKCIPAALFPAFQSVRSINLPNLSYAARHGCIFPKLFI